MDRADRMLLALASLAALASVAAGAFAAHGVADPAARDLLRTGAAYGISHALAVFAALFAAGARGRPAAMLFLAGGAGFSGSLYALALGAPRWLGAITPLGGLAMIAGWAMLAWACLAPRKVG